MNKIVVHFQNGEISKGHTSDFSHKKETFHLTDANEPESNKIIKLNDLKAVFFVKDFQGNFLHVDSRDFSKSQTTGKRITISFFDGEILFGTSETIHRDKIGFFIFPIDSESNTMRVFVINSFIDSIDIVE